MASMTGGVLMPEPDLPLADEPTSSLDPKTSVEIMKLIPNGESMLCRRVIVNRSLSKG
jgi:phosphonate transport system ATP-binding protein